MSDAALKQQVEPASQNHDPSTDQAMGCGLAAPQLERSFSSLIPDSGLCPGGA